MSEKSDDNIDTALKFRHFSFIKIKREIRTISFDLMSLGSGCNNVLISDTLSLGLWITVDLTGKMKTIYFYRSFPFFSSIPDSRFRLPVQTDWLRLKCSHIIIIVLYLCVRFISIVDSIHNCCHCGTHFVF